MTAPSSTPSPLALVVVIDASVWVSNLQSQDSNHPPARAWVDRHLLNGGLFVAPVLLVTETAAAALTRATGQPSIAHHAISQLYNMQEMRLVPIDQTLVDEATTIVADLGIRGADAYYVALAKVLGVPLVTFDKEQLTRSAGIVVVIQP